MLGEASNYSLEQLTLATRLVAAGARFIATNPDPIGPAEGGIVPACGAVAALIERASGVSAFFVGKPNPLMMRLALNSIGAHSESTVMVGDRMDTDVIGGVQTGMETVLVLSGVTRREESTASRTNRPASSTRWPNHPLNAINPPKPGKTSGIRYLGYPSGLRRDGQLLAGRRLHHLGRASARCASTSAASSGVTGLM